MESLPECVSTTTPLRSPCALLAIFSSVTVGMAERVLSSVVKNSTIIYQSSGRARSYNSGTSSLWRVPECVHDVRIVKLCKCYLNVVFYARPYVHGAVNHMTYAFHSDGYRREPPKRSKRRTLHVRTSQTKRPPTRFADRQLDVRRRWGHGVGNEDRKRQWGRPKVIIDTRGGGGFWVGRLGCCANRSVYCDVAFR